MAHPFVEEGDYLINANIIRFTERKRYERYQRNEKEIEDNEKKFENHLKSICVIKEISKEQALNCNILWDKDAPYVWVLETQKRKFSFYSILYFFLYTVFSSIFFMMFRENLKSLIYLVIGLLDILVRKVYLYL